jgi:hypothetical protein
MSAPTAAPTTSGTVTYAWYNGRRAGRINERCSITSGTSSYTLQKTLPSRCRVMMTALKAVSAIVLNSSTATGTSAPESVALCKSLPTTNATSSTVNNIVLGWIRGATGTASNNAAIAAGTGFTSVSYSTPEMFAACKTSVGGSAVAGAGIGAGPYNTATSDLNLYLVPMRGTGTENFEITSVATNSFHFGATGTIDVDVWFEEYVGNPNS